MTTIMITRTITVKVPVAIAISYNDGWDAYYAMLPVGLVVRSNAALAGWKAAREAHRASDVDYV